MHRFLSILVLLFILSGGAARAAHTEVQLILFSNPAAPGTTILAGVRLRMEPGWHTYWKNPGAAGEATEIKWQLPAGITAGKIQWPLPAKLPPAEVTTYGYENEVMLLVPLTIAATVAPGDLSLSAKVSWLECKESCIPSSTQISGVLQVANESQPTAKAPVLAAWHDKVPKIVENSGIQAWWETTTTNDTRTLNLQWPGKAEGPEYFPAASDDFEIQGPTEIIPDDAGVIHLRKQVKKYSGDWPRQISGVFANAGNAIETTIPVASTPPTPVGATEMPTSPAANSQPLWLMLIYAFIGGLILNIMPCVLPVIALKILGFVREASSEPRRVRNLGLIYALGVLVSFLALAVVVIGVNAAGHHAGWGMQFGNPIFLVCLTTLVTLVALNLFGVFEVTLGSRAMNSASELAAKHGAPGAFFNGLLATVLATPCTAPFLAPALGFAFAQKPPTIISIFLFVGLGLSTPYVLLSCNPALLKFLPKPGAWMEKFKIAMGFPMLATVVWLFNVAADSYGKRVLWLGVFLVIVAFAAWIFGEFSQRGRQHRSMAGILAVLLLAGGYYFALENELNWREAIPVTEAIRSPPDSTGGIEWQRWSPEAIAKARADGKAVLVDFTASWCVTCNAIVKPALENSAVAEKIKETGTVPLLADYTRTPPDITEELSKYKSAGVPLVLVYPKNPDLPAVVLPQPSPLHLPAYYSRIILAALDRATR